MPKQDHNRFVLINPDGQGIIRYADVAGMRKSDIITHDGQGEDSSLYLQ